MKPLVFLSVCAAFVAGVVLVVSVTAAELKVRQQQRDLARVAEREAMLIEQREAMRLKLELAQQEIRELRRELGARKRGAK